MNIKNKFFLFNTLPSFFIMILPFLLITGPFLSDLAISLIAFLFLINSLNNKLYKYYNNIYFKFFLFFFIILLTCSLLSPSISTSLKSSIFYIRFFLFSLCFWYLLEHDNFLIKKIFYVFAICFLALFIDGSYQFFFGENIFGIKLYHHLRVSSFFGSELIMGSYVNNFSFVFFGFFFFLYNKKINNFLFNFFFVIIFFVLFLLIVISGERTSIFLFFLTFCYFLIFSNSLKNLKISIIVFLIPFIFALSFSEKIKDRIYTGTYNLIKQNEAPSEKNKNIKNNKLFFPFFSIQHNDHYLSAYKMFLNNKIFGVGPKNFRIFCNDYKYYVSDLSCSTHPHNKLFQLMAETGLLGTLFFIFVNFVFIFYSIKHLFMKLIKNCILYNNFQICLFASIFGSLFFFSPSGNIFNNWMSIIYFYPLGLIMWSTNKT